MEDTSRKCRGGRREKLGELPPLVLTVPTRIKLLLLFPGPRPSSSIVASVFIPWLLRSCWPLGASSALAGSPNSPLFWKCNSSLNHVQSSSSQVMCVLLGPSLKHRVWLKRKAPGGAVGELGRRWGGH